MAAALRPPLPPVSLLTPIPATRRHAPAFTLRCGPRDNRGPLVKGRILSIEAIHAVQTIKLSHNHRNDHQITNSLSRLLKADLVAVLNELIRQNHCHLALTVFSVVKSEPSYSPDLATYASLCRALSKNGMAEEIDRLIGDLDMEADDPGAVKWSDEKSLVKLIRALAEAERKDAIVRVYGMMKMCGWGEEGSGLVVDEYVAKVLRREFTKFGEIELANEVELAHQNFSDACLQRFGAS